MSCLRFAPPDHDRPPEQINVPPSKVFQLHAATRSADRENGCATDDHPFVLRSGGREQDFLFLNGKNPARQSALLFRQAREL